MSTTDENSIDSDFLKIDELRLDKEWLEQPALYYQFSVKLADARKEQDLSKQALDLTEAELNLDIRRDPKSFKLEEKPTEAAIKATIPQQQEYKEALKRVARKMHAVNVLQAAVTALEHRKRALTMLVELHGQNYFSSPSSTKNEKLRDVAKEGEVRRVGKKLTKYERNKEDDE